MCIIAVVPKGHRLTDKDIDGCFAANWDGAGFAFAKDNTVYYEKGIMDEDDLKALYNIVPNDVDHIVHFRTQTSGGAIPELTHPYIVSATSPLYIRGTTAKSVLFHNGIYSDWREHMVSLYGSLRRKIPVGPWSDTRFAAIMLHKLGVETLHFMSGKWAVLHRNGDIDLYGEFTKKDGILYSNTGFMSGGHIIRGYSDHDWRSDYEEYIAKHFVRDFD